jgi:hypothetical protein
VKKKSHHLKHHKILVRPVASMNYFLNILHFKHIPGNTHDCLKLLPVDIIVCGLVPLHDFRVAAISVCPSSNNVSGRTDVSACNAEFKQCPRHVATLEYCSCLRLQRRTDW